MNIKRAKEEIKKNPNVCEPIKIKEHIAPVGYLCFELLKKKYGNNPIMSLTCYSI